MSRILLKRTSPRASVSARSPGQGVETPAPGLAFASLFRGNHPFSSVIPDT